MSLFPRPGRLCPVEIDLGALDRYIECGKDINGHFRNSGLPGAYGYSGLSPGWLPRLERRSGM